MKNKLWFMGKCSDGECPSKGKATSVRFLDYQDDFFCWRCLSSDEHRELAQSFTGSEKKN